MHSILRNLSSLLCKCEALATLRYHHLGPFFLDPEDVRNLSLGAIWHRAPVIRKSSFKGTRASYGLSAYQLVRA